jgi:hypothetical protein
LPHQTPGNKGGLHFSLGFLFSRLERNSGELAGKLPIEAIEKRGLFSPGKKDQRKTKRSYNENNHFKAT